MLKNLKGNKVLRGISNALYTLLVIVVVLILIAVVLQRVSNNSLSLGGIRIFNIVTGSMVPKYQVGDVLISKSIAPSEIKVGDDIVYQGTSGSFAGKIVTHQVIDIEENGNYKFHTKGLANDEEDPVVNEEQVLGKIIYKVKSLSYISKLINNLVTFYFVVFVPIAILIFVEIRRIAIDMKESKEEKKEKDEESK